MPVARRPSPTSADSSSSSSSHCTTAKEGHGHPIYCVAFSRHLHASGGRSSSGTVLDDDDDGHDRGGGDTTATSAIFATCGGPYATIYEIETNQKSASSSSSNSELSARQVYRDVDGGEIFYACAFGGRGSRAGVVPLATAAATTTTMVSTANATTKSNGIVNFGTEQQQRQRQRKSMKRRRRNMDNSTNGGPPLLCLGGTRGIIKIIDTNERALHMTLYGHGNDVTDLKFSPMNEFLLLSASKDESIRLWNISQQRYGGGGGGGGGGGVNLAIFAGHVGHRGQVLSIAWHDSGKQFVSGGMDNMIKLWNIGDMTNNTTTIIDNSRSTGVNNNNNATTTTTATTTASDTTDDENVRLALCKSQSVIPSNWSNEMGKSNSSSERIPSTTQQRQQSRQERNDRTTFDTVFQQFPYFSTNKAHTNYVDCVQFIGDLILSKSAVSNVIVLWKPVVVTSINEKAVYTTTRTIPSNIIFLREFQLDNCSSWYIRFESPGPDYTILACGNECGEVRVWQIDDSSEFDTDDIDDNYKDNNNKNDSCPDYTHSCSLTTSTTLSSIAGGDKDNLSTVRMVAFNPYGSQLVAVKDDSTIWMWDSLG